MDDQDPLDEQLTDALASDDAIDTPAVLTDVVRRGQRRRLRRRVVMGAGVALIIAMSGLAVAAVNSGTDRIHVQGPSATNVSSSTQTTASTTTAPSPQPATSTTILGPGQDPISGSPQPGVSTTTTTMATAAPSPWPDGTYLKADHLINTITFNPAALASLYDPVHVTATITNPDDNWVFVSLAEDEQGNPCGSAYCLYHDIGIVIGRDPSGPYVLVRGSDPTLKHQTAQGEYDGLLLAPHGSYQMSGAIVIDGRVGTGNQPSPNAPETFYAAVILHCGYCFGNQFSYFGDASQPVEGSLTVLPSTTSTTTAPS